MIIHQKLTKIFGALLDKFFAGITITACGYLYQMPLTTFAPVFARYHYQLLDLTNPWDNLKLTELTQVYVKDLIKELLNNLITFFKELFLIQMKLY